MASIDEFLITAKLSNRDFQAQRGLPRSVIEDETVHVIDHQNPSKVAVADAFEWHALPMPERPPWSNTDSTETLEAREVEAFLEWRRRIALTEEAVTAACTSSQVPNAKVTPFEKNLEVWRQLWRVVERSHVLIQVVDARQPLFYYSEQLHDYARLHWRGKGYGPAERVERLMILNKADFLTRAQRRVWARTLKGKGLKFVWFSAKVEQEKLNLAERAANSGLSADEGPFVKKDEQEIEEDESVRLLTRVQLLDYLERLAQSTVQETVKETVLETGAEDLSSKTTTTTSADEQQDEQGREDEKKDDAEDKTRETSLTVGMVGYPNVGKSSVINVLLGVTPLSHGSARVATGATPGKTKHLQTLILRSSRQEQNAQEGDNNEDSQTTPTASAGLTLCDCPGLVFPHFVNSAAEMVCAGVLPVSQLRDHTAPMEIITTRIPRAVLEATYGFKSNFDSKKGGSNWLDGLSDELNTYMTVEEVLVGIGIARSWKAAGNKGEVDRNRVARMVITDLACGKLLVVHPPPNLDAANAVSFHAATHLARLRILRQKKQLKGSLKGSLASPLPSKDPEILDPVQIEPAAAAAVAQTPQQQQQQLGDFPPPAHQELEQDLSFEPPLPPGDGAEAADGGVGDDVDDDLWMETDMTQDIGGDVSNTGIRARNRKNKAMLRKATRTKGKKKNRGGTEDGAGGGAHMNGRRKETMGQEDGYVRRVMPHHPTYKRISKQLDQPQQN